MAFTGVKVFSATKAREREELGENVTRWIRANPGRAGHGQDRHAVLGPRVSLPDHHAVLRARRSRRRRSLAEPAAPRSSAHHTRSQPFSTARGARPCPRPRRGARAPRGVSLTTRDSRTAPNAISTVTPSSLLRTRTESAARTSRSTPRRKRCRRRASAPVGVACASKWRLRGHVAARSERTRA